MKKNLGLDLLRVVMSLGVVFCHFWRTDLHGPDGVWKLLWGLRTIAVPVFMVMTFFLTAARFRESDVGWFRRRLIRLWMPFLFWSVVAWCVARALFVISGTHAVGFGDLVLQLLFGARPAERSSA